MARPVLAGPRPIQCNQWPPGQRHLVIIIILMFIIIILDIIHIIITIIISSITCMIILLLFITIIRVSPPLGRYNAINGQVSILQSNMSNNRNSNAWMEESDGKLLLPFTQETCQPQRSTDVQNVSPPSSSNVRSEHEKSSSRCLTSSF